MAKKATKKTTKKKSTSKKSKGRMNDFINFNKIIGFAAGIVGDDKGLSKIIPTTWDTKLVAVAKIAAGEWLPKQQFAKGLVKNDQITTAAGDALQVRGVEMLMRDFGFISGSNGLSGDEDDMLAVAIEGIDDLDTVNEDVLGDDDDSDTVNDDSDDDLDDLDTINEDVLGDDDEDDLY